MLSWQIKRMSFIKLGKDYNRFLCNVCLSLLIGLSKFKQANVYKINIIFLRFCFYTCIEALNLLNENSNDKNHDKEFTCNYCFTVYANAFVFTGGDVQQRHLDKLH